MGHSGQSASYNNNDFNKPFRLSPFNVRLHSSAVSKLRAALQLSGRQALQQWRSQQWLKW